MAEVKKEEEYFGGEYSDSSSESYSESSSEYDSESEVNSESGSESGSEGEVEGAGLYGGAHHRRHKHHVRKTHRRISGGGPSGWTEFLSLFAEKNKGKYVGKGRGAMMKAARIEFEKKYGKAGSKKRKSKGYLKLSEEAKRRPASKRSISNKENLRARILRETEKAYKLGSKDKALAKKHLNRALRLIKKL